MTMPGLYIRPAKEDELDDLLGLIEELAIYEKHGESAKATKDLLKQNLFATPYAHALLGISPDGEAVGYTTYHFSFSTWTGRPGIDLGDIFVKEAYRAKGLGKAFFQELARIAKEKNCAHIDWAGTEWNTLSLDFYRKIGARVVKDAICLRLDEEGIEQLCQDSSSGECIAEAS